MVAVSNSCKHCPAQCDPLGGYNLSQRYMRAGCSMFGEIPIKLDGNWSVIKKPHTQPPQTFLLLRERQMGVEYYRI